MNWQEMLRDPRWQRRRLEVLDAAGWKCEECGDSHNELQVHHRHYRSGAKPWDYSRRELRALCSACHEKRTDLDREIKKDLGDLCFADAKKVLEFIWTAIHPVQPKLSKEDAGWLALKELEKDRRREDFRTIRERLMLSKIAMANGDDEIARLLVALNEFTKTYAGALANRAPVIHFLMR